VCVWRWKTRWELLLLLGPAVIAIVVVVEIVIVIVMLHYALFPLALAVQSSRSPLDSAGERSALTTSTLPPKQGCLKAP
jgi:hypothetical protein